MSNGKHENHNVQLAYNDYGVPAITALQICKIEELDYLEASWASEFSNLLNIVKPGATTSGRDMQGSASKHTKKEILRVFSLIYKYDLSYREIVKRVRMSKSSIERIGSGSHHTWLRDEYPEEYSIMKSNILKRSRHKAQILNKLNN
jgi:hypothetical protein